MIRLNQTATQLLSLITAQNGANVVVSYSDKTSTAYTGNTQVTNITSATTTTICDTPAASTIRDIDHISVKNSYAGNHSITVQLSSSATLYPILAVTLSSGDSLEFTHGSGWQVLDSNGNKKTTPFSAMTSAQLAALVSDETGSNLLVFNTSPTLVTPILGTPTSGDLRNCSLAVAPAIGGTTPSSGAFTTLSSTGNATLGDSITLDAHTISGKSTLNDARFAAISASLPSLSFVDACFWLEKNDTKKWRKRKGQSWRSETRYTGRYSAASYASATAAYTAGLTGSGTTGDIYYQTGGTAGFYAMTGVNTSTIIYRAGREDYPTNALVTAEAARVIIWDLDGAVPSMWMVFIQGSGYYLGGTSGITSISCVNQHLLVSVATNGLIAVDFVGDLGIYRSAIASTSYYRSNTVSGRNASSKIGALVNPIVSLNVNSVAITILPDAPLDEYGMPIPTIFVATDAGVSVINNNGTVADLVDVAGDDTNEVVFDRNNNCYFTNETQGDLDMFLASNYDADDTTPDANYDNATIPALLAAITATKQGLVATKDSIVAGHSTGLSVLLPSTASKANGMVAYITSTYNTGYMVGDIRRAIGYDSASALADKSVKASAGITEVGTLTKTPVSGGLTAVSGFSAANYIQEASHADFNVRAAANFYDMLSGGKWGTAATLKTLISIGDGASNGSLKIEHLAANTLRLSIYNAGWTTICTSTATFTDTAEHEIGYGRRTQSGVADTCFIEVDGVVVASAVSTLTISNATGYFRIGEGQDASQPWVGGQFSGYVRISATAPTAEGSKFIAQQENALNGSQTCLLSNSNSVSALNYNPDTGSYEVGNGTNEDTFVGLKRIASQAHGVTTLTALASADGYKLIAGTGATFSAVEKNIKSELDDAVPMPRTQQYLFTTPAATTTQALPKGWKAQGIAFNTTDSTFLGTYTQSFDGFLWTMAGLTASKAYQINLVEA